ncbi:MAG TPA: hypothetical protein VIE41_06460 [Methylomirabilota bacterium]
MWQVVKVLPTAVRAATEVAHAAAAALGGLVLVTSLVPVFAVWLAALGVRAPAHGRLSRPRDGESA